MIPKVGQPQTRESGWTAEHVEECSTLVERNAHDVEINSMQNRNDADEVQKAGMSSQQRLDTFEDQ
ncbi:MAG TPA: hypothetical protein VLH08_12000 [Acidobacteriota bacterium]|nr:hypothetical protein [Acidobacteriota bacterium]